MQGIRVAFSPIFLSFLFLFLQCGLGLVDASPIACRHSKTKQKSNNTSSSGSDSSLAHDLPPTPGADVAFFPVLDADSKPRTLLTYFSQTILSNQGSLLQTANVKRAVVVVHGIDADADNSFAAARGALQNASRIDPNVSEESVVVMAPFFGSNRTAEDGLKKRHAGSKSGLTSGGLGSLIPDVLLWSGADWASGTKNSDSSSGRDVSSFEVLDQIMQYFDNKLIYPNMNQIMLVGHSAGGQMTQRYAAVGRELNLTTPVRYWIGNPNSFLFMNSSRPLSTDNCPSFDDWRNGLSAYTNEYESEFVNQGLSANSSAGASSANTSTAHVLDRWYSRDIALARGLDDTGDESSDCGPNTTGTNRDERFLNFISFTQPNAKQTVDYVDAGHDAASMFASDAGMSRLFFDNFYGDSSRAADFGARRVDGDNPHPNDTFIGNQPRPGTSNSNSTSLVTSNITLPRRDRGLVRRRERRASGRSLNIIPWINT